MSTESKVANKLQIKKESDSSKIKEGLDKHGELIAAISSGAIILTTWFLTNVLPHSVWVTLHIVAFFIGGYAQAKEGIIDTIEEKELNVELLMIIAAIGSAIIGYWTEGAILIFIFALAGALETYTLNKSNKEIHSLMALQPEEARIIENGIEKMIPVSQLKVGEVIYVRASERIPADGKIINGFTSVDESPITGESIPVTKEAESEVFAGTVALNGSITVEITKHANETIFQKIIEMIQSAKDEKSPMQLFIERFESTYVNTVLIVVVIMMFVPYLLFGWTLTESIYRAMVLLVVASPCALVASIMPATLSAISKSAKNGVLFKGGVHAENVSQMNVIAFDKTGTLTNGKPEVTDVYVHPDYNEATVHEIVGAIETESTHPLALAIRSFTLNFLNKKSFDVELDHMETVSGKGVIGRLANEKWFVGRNQFVSNGGAEKPFYEDKDKKLAREGKTVVFVGHQDKIIAIYALKDTVRKDAKEAIAAIKKRGIKTIMLTGDNELTAKAVAEETGIDDYVAGCLPNEKVDHIRELIKQHGKVAMVGDGINDAPALALADVGIAMGEGTDVALETADVILMKNDLSRITDSIETSSKMNRIVKQNVFFSLTVIAVLIISNFLQAIDLPLGVIGHEGSTILVILNGLRLLR
ncbi:MULTISPECIES: heavy metal translocating P-type ATPase [Bacillaceae]|uniref:heavy metal translocating P-type ATPase n=1 Tax=Bacillaceae TaxID=186817 RepID=UPI00062174F7|nr:MULTISPECIES: heavy metal translocating P-type ATPase [Bacillaceae]KKE79594.1 ATPase [Bacilli bacterium VT-13-104]PZD89693.1 heavy metal translocating P-type ATPase [Bacilli bacterium]MED4475943.1 heavy metal translocating P-type ATPase [Oceanobacillus caeni]PZD91215.1 heavy metal translocating P-type ATPase [Bacilli bacterium]PZD92762.1 heavy metal translocating P-type ATPase [Bacilli bacterium]